MDKLRAGTYAKIDVSITLSGVYQTQTQAEKNNVNFCTFYSFYKTFPPKFNCQHLNKS